MRDESSDPAHHLSKVDPVMRRLIEVIGPFPLKLKVRRSPFESLARAITASALPTDGPQCPCRNSCYNMANDGDLIVRSPLGTCGGLPIEKTGQ